jgi:hypothetical protein
MAANFGNLMAKLLRQPGFCLQKISRSTFPPDVVMTHRRKGDGYSEAELEGILELVKSGTAFRCRIGKARYYYGRTVAEAIDGALKGAKPC